MGISAHELSLDTLGKTVSVTLLQCIECSVNSDGRPEVRRIVGVVVACEGAKVAREGP